MSSGSDAVRLCALRAGGGYLRERDGEWSLVGLEKASVRPLSDAPGLLRARESLLERFPDAELVSLVVRVEAMP